MFTCDLEHALCLLDICRAEGIAVPEQMAMLANGDDPVLYNVTTPPLSGVDTNPSLVGYKAAALLDRMMAGQPPPRDVLWVPPARVVVRWSTDVIKIADGDVASAVRFIREHACRGIDVSDLAAATSLARRTMERRFYKHLGRTPKEEILRVQLERAKMLLECSDTSIELIAAKERLCLVQELCQGIWPRGWHDAATVPSNAEDIGFCLGQPDVVTVREVGRAFSGSEEHRHSERSEESRLRPSLPRNSSLRSE